ncbi:uncharacterized protein Hen1 [Venturia canescens]|uniref:uncharacterized protein Hen1 n=1 Tax=Venturia canescens TaxID=32260 RepID=UPI001C9C76D6|nr:uncharacterized protein LOC122410568 [Venturia canescens]XP_043274723.1 uncharacterized protein LOC122410568 [Venturia canescens]
MIIVFFHVLYLIGKIVYDNYQCNRLTKKDKNGDDEEACSSPQPPVPQCKVNDCQQNSYVRDLYDADYEDNDDFPRAPRFSPPAFIQRYLAVVKVLTDVKYHKKIKKVVDFGCSELGFLVYLKNTPGIEEILCIDVDRETLNRHKDKAIPLNADYLQHRQNPLVVHVYEGSVTHRDKILTNCDAVVAIELIEHLYPDTLVDVPYNIFGFIKPLVAIITTPNADFNVLFPRMKKSDMRHWDHKFEWTREQFENWAQNIVTRYPEYNVSFEGIGAGPPGTEELGCCSQMAIFTRVNIPSEVEMIFGVDGLLKNVTSQEYPYRVDNRSDEQKILDEATYHIRNFARTNDEGAEEYPLEDLMKKLESFHITGEALREILVNGGWTICESDEGPMILCPEQTTFSDYDFEAEMDERCPEFDWNTALFHNSSDNWRENNVEGNYDEFWDDDYGVPAITTGINDVASNDLVPEEDSNIPEVEFSSSETLDINGFDGLEVTWPLNPPSSENRLSNFESDPDWDTESNRQDSSFEIGEAKDLISNVEAIEGSLSLIKSEKEKLVRISGLSTLDLETSGCELGSICSINLECSRNEAHETCPRDITNPEFDCTELQGSFEDSREIQHKTELPERFCPDDSTDKYVEENPQCSSSPKIPVAEKSQSETSLAHSEIAPSTETDSSTSFRTVKKWFPPEVNEMYSNGQVTKLKGGNESSDIGNDEPSLAISDTNLSESFVESERSFSAARLERQRTPVSLSLRSNVSCAELSGNTSKMQEDSKKSNNTAQQISNESDIFQTQIFHGSNDHPQASGASRVEQGFSVSEEKPEWPDAPETPSNSWSPEIMDSGYPNSASMQDTTPEYDLSSIAQDRISSDSESPSVAEVPRPGFLDHAEVENGDLANNNRDGQGNNVAAPEVENELDDDLQPLIDGLENDIENENDIYAVENDFPVWLLRILERGNVAGRRPIPQLRQQDENQRLNVNAAGDAGLPELDEGFDSTDSENDDGDAVGDDDDDDEDDDDDDDDDDDGNEDEENLHEFFVESSEESIDWNVSGDH